MRLKVNYFLQEGREKEDWLWPFVSSILPDLQSIPCFCFSRLTSPTIVSTRKHSWMELSGRAETESSVACRCWHYLFIQRVLGRKIIGSIRLLLQGSFGYFTWNAWCLVEGRVNWRLVFSKSKKGNSRASSERQRLSLGKSDFFVSFRAELAVFETLWGSNIMLGLFTLLNLT